MTVIDLKAAAESRGFIAPVVPDWINRAEG